MVFEINEVVTYFSFKENIVNQCIYLKVSGSKYIILVVYVEYVLLANNDIGLLFEIKQILSKTFEIKDLGEISFVLDIAIDRHISCNLLDWSQKVYINRVLERFDINCSPKDAPVVKGYKFCKFQCLKNDVEKEATERILYASAVGSLMNTQVCIRPNIATLLVFLECSNQI